MEYVPLERLTLFHRNPRRGRVDVVRRSLLAHGQYTPLLVNRGTLTGRPAEVLVGNHRLLALRDLQADPGPRDDEERLLISRAPARMWSEVAVCWTDVDDDEADRIVVVDNRSSDVASNDNAVLLQVLEGLSDLSGTGYVVDDVAAIAAAVAAAERRSRTDPDDAPDPPDEETVTRRGDTWRLGLHRLVCGDATRLETVQLALDGRPAAAVFTDPPYGVAYEGKTKRRLTIANETVSEAQLDQLLDASFKVICEVLAPGGVFYVCAPAGPSETRFRLALGRAGLQLRQQIVWVKDRFVLGHSDYHYQHESIMYGWRDGAGHHWEGGRNQTTVWEYARPSRSDVHPTMKPVAMVARAVANNTPPGAVVLDPFAGSGSTLMACHLTDRVAALVELLPTYVDVICRRWQEHTGEMPTREGVAHDFGAA